MKHILFTTGMLLALAGCAVQQDTDAMLDIGNRSSRSSGAMKQSSSSSIDEHAYPPLSDLEKQKAEAYLGSNIDAFVTVAPSVLGGRFYTTGIEWYTDNTALVSYEDGHIQGRARVTMSVSGDNVDVVQFTELSAE